MKKIKYKISRGEIIGTIPENVFINCYLVYEEADTSVSLIYIPKKIHYLYEDEEFVEGGCGSLSFAIKKENTNYYIKSKSDYINLTNKDSKLFESQIES